MRNIIFIEGVSGVGKSTTVRALGSALRDIGYLVKYYTEGDPNSPLDLCWTAYLTNEQYRQILSAYPQHAEQLDENVIYCGEYILLRYQVGRTALYSPQLHRLLHQKEFCYNPENKVSLTKFTEVFLQLWSRYMQSAEFQCDYAVFDASLVSHMTNDLISNYNASPDEMSRHLTALLAVVRSANPIVFYLSSQNVRQRLTAARKSRGQTPPDDDRVAFWEKRKRLDIPILSALPVQSRIFDVSNGDWNLIVSDMVLQVTGKTFNIDI